MSNKPAHVCMSAFDKDECYTDHPDMIVGWTVYSRTDPEVEPYETFDEKDFTTYENARAYAMNLCATYNITDLREF